MRISLSFGIMNMVKNDKNMNNHFQQQLKNAKENPKIKKAMDVFEVAQKTYERAIEAMTIRQKTKQNKGSYSSSISKKEYYADFSTTTR